MNPPIHIFLKFHRLKKGISQEQLCEGICSVSYYSKIENGQTVPSEEILSHLKRRLNVSINIQDNSRQAREILQSWYKQIIFSDEAEIKSTYTELKEMMSEVFEPTLHNLFILFEFRYLLRIRDFKKASDLRDDIENLKDIFDETSFYYYYKFNGQYLYFYGDYHASTQMYEKAEAISKGGSIETWEKADLFFHMASSYFYVYKVSKTAEYTNQALELFYGEMNYQRTAECQLILGVSYKRTGDYEKAEASFALAQKAAKNLNMKQLQKGVDFHIGMLYSAKGNSEKAIELFLGAYTELIGYRYSMNIAYYIIQEYAKIGNWDEVSEWSQKGISLIDDPQRLEDYLHHFVSYKKLSEGNFQDFKLYVTMKVIPYFRKRKLFEHVSHYSFLLGKELEKQRKYKDSSRYYRMAYQAHSEFLYY